MFRDALCLCLVALFKCALLFFFFFHRMKIYLRSLESDMQDWELTFQNLCLIKEVIYLSGLSWNCLYHYCFLRTLLKPYISDCSSISLEKGLCSSDSEVLYFLLHHWAQHWWRNERWSWLRELCKCDVWFFFFFLGCFWWINYSCLAAVVH